MKVSFESSYKSRQSGSYNPPSAAIIIEHGIEFAHHGVKNQHWGIKNGPPYPLTGENKQKAKASYKKPPKNPEKEGDYKPESSSSSGGGGGSSKSTKETKETKERKDVTKTKQPKKDYNKMSYFELENEYGKTDTDMMKRWHEYEKALSKDDRFKKDIAKANKIKKEHGGGISTGYWEAMSKVDKYIMEQDDMKAYMKKLEELDEYMRKKGRY